MKRRLAGAAITALVAGLAAGCGGDGGGGGGDGSTTAAPTGPSKAQFIARADAICSATARRIDAAAAKLRNASERDGTLPKAEVARFFENTSLPAYEVMLERLRKLTLPQGDERTVDGYLSALAAAVDTFRANPIKFASRTSPDPFATANTRAQRYGLKACGS